MKELHIKAIENGTAIDHIPPGRALKVLSMLHLPLQATISMAMHVDSRRMKKKDLIYAENYELKEQEIKKIGLVARNATLNIIRNSEVAVKQKITLPETIRNAITCPNPACITNHEKIPSDFELKDNPLEAKCHYCERVILEEKQILENLK
ncbi:MAG: aspartate carbamoyltransferase regulatory subunit [Candidatus Diapherotrites archaeon]|nr:aspartate carbamoyltransferase regulatory subunit [Candidatus Diapherotrites archaeon]